ncbi:MAG TPA: hypothetical protein VMS56_04735 [Thermoanaerobaculia bacterium]|nr:hypothetical protein [Thermoanaerobaculia bacterium]
MRIPLLAPLLLLVAPLGAAEIDHAIEQVESIRGLEFRAPVEVAVVPRADLRAILEEQIAKDSPLPLGDYMRLLEQLLLIERSEGAIDDLMEVYEAQVLAFYDPSSRKYYTFDRAPGGSEMGGMMEDAVAIHELTHALQDQRFGAGDRIRSLRSDWDAQLAYHSVLEGEATLVMLASMLSRLGISIDDLAASAELVEGMGALASLDPGFPGGAPPYFVESLKFPYLSGLAFVLEAFRRGGWEGVDRLHREPPATTLEVLDPEIYYARTSPPAPRRCEGPESLIATPLGAFHWAFLLGEAEAAGWSSDCVRVFSDQGALRVEGTSRWADPSEAREFAAALSDLLEARGRVGAVEIDGLEVRFSWSADVPARPDAQPAVSSPRTSSRACSQASRISW